VLAASREAVFKRMPIADDSGGTAAQDEMARERERIQKELDARVARERSG